MEPIQATVDFSRVAEHTAEITLGALEPPILAEQSLARLAVQRSLRFDFTEQQHVDCAQPQPLGKSWSGAITRVLKRKYGDTNGFTPADLDVEATMLDLDEIIWDADIEAEKQRILRERLNMEVEDEPIGEMHDYSV